MFNGVLNGCLVRSDFGVLNLGRGVVGILYVSFFLRGWIHSWALADGENDLAANVPHVKHWVGLCKEWFDLHGLNKIN